MIDGIKYHGADRFIVTKDRMVELLEAEVIKTVGIEFGLFDGIRWDDAMEIIYSDKGSYPYAVADSIVAELVEGVN